MSGTIVNIRASSLGALFDCPARWAATHIDGLRMPSNGKATLGRAVHAALPSTTNRSLYEGVHAAVPGPYFLTLAESKMVRLLGADTIGMSMVPEVIVANHASVRCLGIACVTDAVFPKNAPPGQVSHQQVSANGNQIEPQFQWLVENLIKRMD